MKKQLNFPQTVALIVVIIGAFLIVLSSVEQPITEDIEEKPAEIHALGEELIEEETKVEKPIKEEAKEELKEEKVTIEIIEEEPEVIEPPIVKTIISNEKCENGIITLTLNNLFNDTINIKMSTFFISGKINPIPGCDKESLEPGESTFCSNVGRFPRRGRRRVAIAIYKHTTVGATVDCGDSILTEDTNLVTGSVIKAPIYYNEKPIFPIVMLLLLLLVLNYYRVHH